MSTHCGIAIKTGDGYDTIYCHHDGYPEYMWKMLTENYNSGILARDLVSMGDASSISAQIAPSPYSGHSFDTPEKGICVFYHRDRGEDWSDVAPANFVKQSILRSFDYAYIWEDGRWHFYEDGKETY
jgi:hypothetical protein